MAGEGEEFHADGMRAYSRRGIALFILLFENVLACVPEAMRASRQAGARWYICRAISAAVARN